MNPCLPSSARSDYDFRMKSKTLELPEIGLIAVTRVALGLGAGLLVSEKMNDDQRRAAGWTLLAVGILTTVPLVWKVLSKDSD